MNKSHLYTKLLAQLPRLYFSSTAEVLFIKLIASEHPSLSTRPWPMTA